MAFAHRLQTLALTAGLLYASAAQARNLADDYLAAQRHEPGFAAAQMAAQNQRIDAQVAASAYYPRAGISLSQDAIDNSTRRTLRLTQPVLSAERWLTTREAGPREQLAELQLGQARIDLAARLFAAVREVSLSRERLQLNRSNLQALQAQRESAEMAFRLGQGTVTDVLDTRLRLAQAAAQITRLQAEHDSARRLYASLTGYLPAADAYVLRPLQPGRLQSLPLPDLPTLIDQSLQTNPRLQGERQTTALSALQARRARAQFLPSVNATVQRSQSGTTRTEQNGLVISFDLPLQYSSRYAFESADNALIGQQQKERATQENLQLELQRQHAHAQAALQEVQITLEAIEAAALSVQANEQSFAGGVRSKLDVLNALQAELSAREAHLNAQMTLAHAQLSLRLLAGHDIAEVLAQLQQQLFDAP